MLKVVQNRLTPATLELLAEEEAGFQAGRIPRTNYQEPSPCCKHLQHGKDLIASSTPRSPTGETSLVDARPVHLRCQVRKEEETEQRRCLQMH